MEGSRGMSLKTKLMSIFTALALAITMVPIVPGVATEADAATFAPRMSRPAASNSYYYSKSYNPYYVNNLAPTGHKYDGYYVTGNCTWYAWGRAYEITGKRPAFTAGNPYKILTSAKSAGYTVDMKPSVGSLVVFDKDSSGTYHIAVVEKIQNGVTYVSESGFGKSSKPPSASTIRFNYGSIASWNSGRKVLGYIHLGNFGTCSHSSKRTTYSYLGSGQHKATTKCASCGATTSTATKTCTAGSTAYAYRSYNAHTVTTKCSLCSGKFSENKACSFTTSGSDRKCSKCGKIGQPLAGNTVVNIASGSYFIRAATASSIALDVPNGASAAGTYVSTKAFNKNNSQQFAIAKNEYGNYSIGYWPLDASGKLLGVSSWSNATYTRIAIRDYCKNHMINQWFVEKTPQGNYMLRNKYSNLYLDIQGKGGLASGMKVIQFTGKQDLNETQQFILDRVGVNQATITGVKNKTYNVKAQTCALTVKVGNKKLVEGADYTVAYSNNKYVGKAKVVIKGKGNYNGTVAKTFTIAPQATKNLKLARLNNGFKASWSKRTTQVTGYQVAYKQVGAKAWKYKNVTGCKTNSKKITGLKDRKSYYVNVRTYKTVGGVKYYSAWAGLKKVTTK